MATDFTGGASSDGPNLDGEKAAVLIGKAEHCRRLAAGISDRQAADVLRKMAVNYETSASSLNDCEPAAG